MASPEAADLQVDFLHGSHGDGYPFDGAGGAVGHAFFPSDLVRAGGVHLDAEEDWAFRQPGRGVGSGPQNTGSSLKRTSIVVKIITHDQSTFLQMGGVSQVLTGERGA